MLPGEGSDTDFPLLRLAVDILLGAVRVRHGCREGLCGLRHVSRGLLCGLAGGLWASASLACVEALVSRSLGVSE